jgi:hypothetical protein
MIASSEYSAILKDISKRPASVSGLRLRQKYPTNA